MNIKKIMTLAVIGTMIGTVHAQKATPEKRTSLLQPVKKQKRQPLMQMTEKNAFDQRIKDAKIIQFNKKGQTQRMQLMDFVTEHTDSNEKTMHKIQKLILELQKTRMKAAWQIVFGDNPNPSMSTQKLADVVELSLEPALKNTDSSRLLEALKFVYYTSGYNVEITMDEKAKQPTPQFQFIGKKPTQKQQAELNNAAMRCAESLALSDDMDKQMRNQVFTRMRQYLDKENKAPTHSQNTQLLYHYENGLALMQDLIEMGFPIPTTTVPPLQKKIKQYSKLVEKEEAQRNAEGRKRRKDIQKQFDAR